MVDPPEDKAPPRPRRWSLVEVPQKFRSKAWQGKWRDRAYKTIIHDHEKTEQSKSRRHSMTSTESDPIKPMDEPNRRHSMMAGSRSQRKNSRGSGRGGVLGHRSHSQVFGPSLLGSVENDPELPKQLVLAREKSRISAEMDMYRARQSRLELTRQRLEEEEKKLSGAMGGLSVNSPLAMERALEGATDGKGTRRSKRMPRTQSHQSSPVAHSQGVGSLDQQQLYAQQQYMHYMQLYGMNPNGAQQPMNTPMPGMMQYVMVYNNGGPPMLQMVYGDPNQQQSTPTRSRRRGSRAKSSASKKKQAPNSPCPAAGEGAGAADKRLVYVDYLPARSTIASVRALFSIFGNITDARPVASLSGGDKSNAYLEYANGEDVPDDLEIKSVMLQFEHQGSVRRAVRRVTAYNRQFRANATAPEENDNNIRFDPTWGDFAAFRNVHVLKKFAYDKRIRKKAPRQRSAASEPLPAHYVA